MKRVLIVLCLVLISGASPAQETEIPELKAHFSAIIVTNMASSIAWYTEMLGFEIVDKRELPEAGFKQANLKRGNALVELIQINSALEPKKVIPGYNPKTRLTGIFKVGFLVSEFDTFLYHLKANNANFQGNVVVEQNTGKRMIIIKDPDENRIQIFEN